MSWAWQKETEGVVHHLFQRKQGVWSRAMSECGKVQIAPNGELIHGRRPPAGTRCPVCAGDPIPTEDKK